MDKKTNSGDEFLLIDFNSPAKGLSRTPLIPVPCSKDKASLSPLNSNPFDVVVGQIKLLDITNNDPFESVFKNVINNNNSDASKRSPIKVQFTDIPSEEKPSAISEISREQIMIEDNIVSNQHNCDNINAIHAQHQQNLENKTNVNNYKKQDLFNTDMTENKETHAEITTCLKPRDDCSSQMSADFSTEDDIKALIAKRVNRCIQNVLTNNISNCQKSNTEENKNSGKIVRYVKSASFTTSSSSNRVCVRLNQSCTETCCSDVSFTNCPDTPDSSIGSCNLTPISFLSAEVSNDKSTFLTSEKDEVFYEANKLARTFSKIAESFCENNDNDDLLTCQPQWSYADSSEDETDKLRKDPALNIRVSLSNPMTQVRPDSKALTEFTSKYRRSCSILQGINSTPNIDNTLKRSLSIGSRPLIAPVLPTVVPTVPKLEEKDLNSIKLKKKPLMQLKKGPMRAIMPLKTMAKPNLPPAVELARQQPKSPTKKKNLSHNMISPIKDTSQLSLLPVASSTPNKCDYSTPTLLGTKPQRHSLGCSSETRQSRTLLIKEGCRPRSNSADIPSPATFNVQALGPRSTSNLLPNSMKSKVGFHQNKDLEKGSSTSTKQTKPSSNPKPLNEVKPKISRPSKLKRSVNAISNMIHGKNKKAALQDKENRSPL